ncbi:MAG TPA: hypothetical protein VFT20_15675 [Candidatus Limnocylindrales bacterium]|nr:hypothetical protein [Candidatus Limnocylindrales bacterium]
MDQCERKGPLRGSVPGIDHGLPFRLSANQIRLDRNGGSSAGRHLRHIEPHETLIGGQRLRTRRHSELVAQRADARVVRAEARRAISDEGRHTHQGLIPGLGQRIDGHEATELLHSGSILAALFESGGERIDRFEHLGSEAVAMRFDPVVVDPGQEVATVHRDRCSQAVDTTRHRVLDGVLEGRDVQVERTVRPPSNRSAFDGQQAFGVRQRAPEGVEFTSKVREGLSVARVGPQRVRDLGPFERPVAVEQEIRDEPRVPYLPDTLPRISQGKMAEQLHLEHRFLRTLGRYALHRSGTSRSQREALCQATQDSRLSRSREDPRIGWRHPRRVSPWARCRHGRTATGRRGGPRTTSRPLEALINVVKPMAEAFPVGS